MLAHKRASPQPGASTGEAASGGSQPPTVAADGGTTKPVATAGASAAPKSCGGGCAVAAASDESWASTMLGTVLAWLALRYRGRRRAGATA